ncbi:hypothetical protein BJX99DRAFT_217312 [Aspergillus californicus]
MMSPFTESAPRFISKSSIPFLNDINIGLVVDDVLDIAILRSKFAELIDSSPVLGGTVLNKTDIRQFKCGSTVDFEGRPLKHDLSSFLPFPRNCSTNPTILHGDFPNIDDKFMYNPTLDPKPVCQVRATVLNDATLLCFSFVHGLFDGQSAFEMIQYYCDLLSNKPIPDFTLPPDTNGSRMSDLVQVPPGSHMAPPSGEMFITKTLGLLRILAQTTCSNLLEYLGLTERMTHKMIHLPGSWVNDVRKIAQKELDTNTDSNIQLTRNDVIAAFYLKLVYSSRPVSDKPVDYFGPVNYRPLLDSPAKGTYYNHNSIILLRCRFSEDEVQMESIAKIAERIRLATLEYKSPAVIQRELRFIEDKVLAPAVPKSRGAMKWGLPFVTPWTTFDFKRLDFSGACLAACQRRPSVVFVNPDLRLIGGNFPNPLLISVKDGSGGYWVRAAHTASGWETFEHWASLERLFL